VSITTLALLNIPEAILDAVAAVAGISDSFALPARCTTITWQTIFGTDPSAINITLEVSLDGANFNVIDTTTATAGEIRTIEVNATHVRAQINSITDGSEISVLVDCKDL